MAYETTSVPVEKSQGQIRKLLTGSGATPQHDDLVRGQLAQIRQEGLGRGSIDVLAVRVRDDHADHRVLLTAAIQAFRRLTRRSSRRILRCAARKRLSLTLTGVLPHGQAQAHIRPRAIFVVKQGEQRAATTNSVRYAQRAIRVSEPQLFPTQPREHTRPGN